MPIFFHLQPHDRLTLPLDGVDPLRVGEWLEEALPKDFSCGSAAAWEWSSLRLQARRERPAWYSQGPARRGRDWPAYAA
jgi:hypothetical protein